MIKNKISGFSVVELLIIISIVAALLIVAAPSFYGIFKRQFIVYDTNYLVQNIRIIQSKSFIDHQYYKVEFNDSIPNYTLSYFKSNQWNTYDIIKIDDSQLIYNDLLNNTNGIVYGPNGNAYICNSTELPSTCKNSPLTTKAQISLKIDSKEIDIDFLPISGLVSSNISVK